MDVVMEKSQHRTQGDPTLQNAETLFQRALASGEIERIDDLELARILTLAIKVYATKVDERCRNGMPIVAEDLTPTEVVVAVADILHAAGLNLWDLSMWLQRPRSDGER